MYSIQSCPDGWPDAEIAARRTCDAPVTLHLLENRSSLSQEARVTFTTLISLFMAMAILPAAKGELLVPVFSIGTMALLLGAIEWHRRKRPANEWLTIERDRLRWRSNSHDIVDFPTRFTRLVKVETTPSCLRLFLETRFQRIEIGRCLSLDEKRSVASLIARRLKEAAT